MNFKPNTIWQGDNLAIMCGMNSDCIDLIYLDPPFNSKANYAAPAGSKAAGAEFKDTWTLSDIDVEWVELLKSKHKDLYWLLTTIQSKSDKSYLIYMARRLIEMKRILKSTGSIYLHCDPMMSHYLKLVMDVIFGRDNFFNEIVWHYTGGGRSKKYFSHKHDIILCYRKSHNYTFNTDSIRVPYKETSRYAKGGITSGSGKHYMPHPDGTPVDDVWDIPIINPLSKERTGYPTQKPLILLDRIIKASSNKDDVILDPFCGCATTCVAAHNLQRRWVGIDISPVARMLVEKRINESVAILGKYDGESRDDVPQRTDLGKLPPPATHKDLLYGEQGGNCNGCRNHFEKQNLEIDHIFPRAKGGTDHVENLQLLCGSCNRIKGNRPMEYLNLRLKELMGS